MIRLFGLGCVNNKISDNSRQLFAIINYDNTYDKK